MRYYIVRDWSETGKGKYAIKTTDIVAALRKLDELAESNTPRELTQKTGRINQLQCVSQADIDAGRARM